MKKEKTSFYERLILNWKTTTAAIVPAVIAIGVWAGTEIDPQMIQVVLGGIWAVVLLFAKD